MSGLIVIIVFCSGGLVAAILRLVQRKEQRARLTREWIDFLKEDLADSSL